MMSDAEFWDAVCLALVGKGSPAWSAVEGANAALAARRRVRESERPAPAKGSEG